MMAAKILLVDDDVELAGMLAEYLEREGFVVDKLHEGNSAITAATTKNYSLAIVDVMMPGKNGIEVLSAIRAQSTLPVLMLTARGDDIDRVLGLELGADDYVPKPCTPRELAARVRAILRRSENNETTNISSVIELGPLKIWPSHRRAKWHDQPLNLTSTEFNLLEVLVQHAGKVVSKADLSAQGLGRPLGRFDRNVDVHMSSIRHKLGNLKDGRSCIQTVIRKGYQFVPE